MEPEKKRGRGCPPGAGTIESQPLIGYGPERMGLIGNPPHEVTQENRDKIRLLAKIGSRETVAEAMGFSRWTLTKYYDEDFKAGEREAVNAVKTKVLSQALEGNMNAAKTFLQMKGELKRHTVVSAPDGGPVQIVDLTRLNEKQLEQYGRLSAIAAGLDPDGIIIEPLD